MEALLCQSKKSESNIICERKADILYAGFIGSPDKPRGLSIQPCKSEKEEPYIRHSSQGRSECLYLRIE